MSLQTTNDGEAPREARDELLKMLDAKIAEYEKKYPTNLSEEDQAKMEDYLSMTFRNQYRQMSGLAAEARKSKSITNGPSDDPVDK
jgi:hypothetical protein